MSQQEHGLTGISGIVQELQCRADQLAKQHKDLTDQTKQANRELRRLRGAIRALGGTVGSSPTESRPKAFSTREVVQLINEVLAVEGSLEIDELRKRVEAKARTPGRSLTGFHLRFNRATEDGGFVVTEGAVECMVSRGPLGMDGGKE